MNSNRIRLLLGLDKRDGKFTEFETMAQEMVALTMKEDGTLIYEFPLGADQKRCRLIETYNHAHAIAEHFKRGRSADIPPTVAAGGEPDCLGIPWRSWAGDRCEGCPVKSLGLYSLARL